MPRTWRFLARSWSTTVWRCTVSEGHVDEIKFAVARLLGTIFLKDLVDKTVRGMEAAVLAGRFAGGRAYGYERLVRLDARGEVIRGLLDIDEQQATIARRIFLEFAAGASSIQIATRLDVEGIPGPRGGQWNASTIRGDPKKDTGILNNALCVGRLIWGRRQWRRNPDSEERERRYRLRDCSESIEIEQRRRPDEQVPVADRSARSTCVQGLSAATAAVPGTRSPARTITAVPAIRSVIPALTKCRSARARSRQRPLLSSSII